MIYDDYINYTNQFTEKYGPKTVVFMQVGDFFELYAVQNESERAGADIYKIAELCNIQVSRKNKSILENSRQNPLMAGFPLATISKFIQIMLQHNYTNVLIRQTTPPPNPKREVTEIISPATTLSVNTPASSYLMTVYWENLYDHSTQKKYLSLGAALLDITTGKSHTYEAYSSSSDPNYALDEAYRLFCQYRPAEMVFLGEATALDTQVIEQPYRSTTSLHSIWEPKHYQLYHQVSYQTTILEKVFGKSLLSPIEMLHLERSPLATLAYTYMIQFAYEHNETIVQKIEPPTLLSNSNHLVLEANSAYQLNILSHTQEQTLLDILNQTKTAFGSRLFKERLLNPILDIATLQERYNQIEFYKNHYTQLSPLLASILDLERIIRKIGLQRLQPCEWLSLHTSLETASLIYQKLNKAPLPHTIISHYQAILNLEECAKYNLQDIFTSLFQPHYSPPLDALSHSLNQHFTALTTIANSLDPTLCKLDCNERDGYFLTTTKKRWESIKQPSFTAKPISPTSTTLRITSPAIEEHSNQILLLQRKISLLNTDLYKQFLTTFYEQHHSLFQTLIQELADMDVACANARNATEYNYQRPTLLSDTSSHLTITDLRHPIIERLTTQTTPYVTNDVQLTQTGMLLYGINASGKSSLMKSIGLAVIMAQAGMYVAAGTLQLAPYKHLFTRITTMDNIWRGLSTFTVEMLELKNILHRCDKHSLVLGDELCAGTEAVSGIAIVAAGINELQKKGASFVFATHLHELQDLELPPLTIQHMHIEIENNKIIYDRKLKPGSGSPLYGLEVCRFLQMPEEFLQKANEVRKKIQKVPPHLVPPRKSRYNASVFVATCELCGQPATETHHITPQKDASHQLIHHPSNLINLCEACHLQQHTGTKIIHTKVQTSQGPTLQYKETSLPLSSPPPKDLTQALLYQITGWYYRLKPTEKWKKLSPSNLSTAFQKLQKQGYPVPTQPEEIHSFLQAQEKGVKCSDSSSALTVDKSVLTKNGSSVDLLDKPHSYPHSDGINSRDKQSVK